MRALIALAAMACPAVAEPIPCMGAPDLIAHMAERYGEEVLASGTAQDQVRIVVTVNPDTRSWTVLVVRPDGTACPVAAGTDWRMLPQGVPS